MAKVYQTIISLAEKELKPWWKKDSGLVGLSEGDLAEPKQLNLQLTDEETMENFDAVALVCNNREKLSDSDTLQVVDFETSTCIKELFIKIIEKIEEPEVQLNFNTKKQRLSQKGDILKSLLK
ncbi:MAG: hypothetical protein RO469_10105 [Thermincola sp.]|jgi:hypothetical protein|nr:hypothetical protein [Thermincola sp.]MDT3703208.1 hypothetical protein [Thermincola sp.]